MATNTLTAQQAIDGLTEERRFTHHWTDYVVYSDGAHRCVMYAQDWDAPIPDDVLEEMRAESDYDYDVWCKHTRIVQDDDVLQAAADMLDRPIYDGAAFVRPDDDAD